jgi:hypothetical protein
LAGDIRQDKARLRAGNITLRACSEVVTRTIQVRNDLIPGAIGLLIRVAIDDGGDRGGRWVNTAASSGIAVTSAIAARQPDNRCSAKTADELATR